MFKKLSLFALALTSSLGSLCADDYLSDYNSSNTQWRVTGEYLYLLPTVDDTGFVIDSPVTTTYPNGKRKDNDANFHSGYRVGAGYTFCGCNNELLASYTHLQFDQSKKVSGDFLWATVGRPDLTSLFEDYAGTASSKLDFLYQRLDGLYSHQLYDNCGLNFAFLFGLEAVELRLKERYTYESATFLGTVHQKSRVEAIGPQIGFAANYQLYKHCGCMPGTLSLNVLSSASLLAADNKVKVNNTLDGETLLDVSNSKSWRVIPALHASVGISYDMPISCYEASIGVSYEFSSYLRGRTGIIFADDVADSLSYNNYNNFDIQGLAVSASFRF